MRSDYLDTSNQRRLLAFFQFCDVANKATASIEALNISEPRLRACAAAVIGSMREQLRTGALEVFDPFIPSYPRSWPKRPFTLITLKLK